MGYIIIGYIGSQLLNSSTNVESEANNKVYLYVTDVFQGSILNLLNTHNNPEKKKLKITKWENRDFDMLIGIFSWCFFPAWSESPGGLQASPSKWWVSSPIVVLSSWALTTFTGAIKHKMIPEAYTVGPGIRITLKG